MRWPGWTALEKRCGDDAHATSMAKKWWPLVFRQTTGNVHDGVGTGLAEQRPRRRLCGSPRRRGIAKQGLTKPRYDEWPRPAILVRRAFGYPALCQQRLQVSGQCRTIMVVASAKRRAAYRAQFLDHHKQRELRRVDPERPQRIVIDCCQHTGNLTGTGKQATPQDFGACAVLSCGAGVGSLHGDRVAHAAIRAVNVANCIRTRLGQGLCPVCMAVCPDLPRNVSAPARDTGRTNRLNAREDPEAFGCVLRGRPLRVQPDDGHLHLSTRRTAH
ncbi:hypothetical protein LMG31506_05555 [Cupriavidus yeoncheonensis]|uniref:Uncharacterized protein n=1 Tax=Cupriavidus yeoncheonensis TaxID=1462994 RepID=A0A916J0R8_9BURK|nr:hypothetical protein LMG31506_05555 [Cupriavidus yeoncheonensis]